MNRNDLYLAYVARATAANVRVLKNLSFNSKQAIIDATDAIPVVIIDIKASRKLDVMPLSGTMCSIIDKLVPHQRARARRWWRAQPITSHILKDRWASSVVPVELAIALGVRHVIVEV